MFSVKCTHERKKGRKEERKKGRKEEKKKGKKEKRKKGRKEERKKGRTEETNNRRKRKKVSMYALVHISLTGEGQRALKIVYLRLHS